MCRPRMEAYVCLDALYLFVYVKSRSGLSQLTHKIGVDDGFKFFLQTCGSQQTLSRYQDPVVFPMKELELPGATHPTQIQLLLAILLLRPD